jgi:hypothetical protein
MKLTRLMVVLFNFVLIGLLVFAGVSFYLKKGYFDELTWEKADIKKSLKKDYDPNRDRSREDYRVIADLSPRPTKPPPPTDKGDDPPPTLQIEVRSVVFNNKEPENSGAHIIAKGVPRYFQVGDDQQIASDMPYRLKEIKEDKPDKEYTLVFVDDKGKLSQTKYRKK